jgi:hypothetical protein
MVFAPAGRGERRENQQTLAQNTAIAASRAEPSKAAATIALGKTHTRSQSW